MKEQSIDITKRLRVALQPWDQHLVEKRMFGGVCFLYKGKMSVGETKGRLVVRVISEKMYEIMASPHVSPMDFTGKPMKEFVYVSSDGIASNEELQLYVELGIEHAKSKTEN